MVLCACLLASYEEDIAHAYFSVRNSIYTVREHHCVEALGSVLCKCSCETHYEISLLIHSFNGAFIKLQIIFRVFWSR